MSMLESAEVVLTQMILPCGHDIADMSDDEAMENLTAGADVMWKAAAQAVKAGRTRSVKFLMSTRDWWLGYTEHFAKEMQKTAPGLVADGRLVML